MNIKREVIHFQRLARNQGNFSLEFIFEDVRQRLKNHFTFRVVIAKYESNGLVIRLRNTVYAARHQGQLNHITGDIHYICLFLDGNRTILTILDCGFMIGRRSLKHLFLKTFWLTIPVRKCRYITTISEASKSDIIKYTQCNPDKIQVIPVAVSEIYKPDPKAFNKNHPVLLQIGTAPNKNLERLFEAIEGIHCQLVIVGRLNDHMLGLLQKRNIDYINKWNISMEDLNHEYRACDIVTFISTFEGFGMPIIEANWVERPVIAGQNSSMIDVAGEAALLVNAWSTDDMRKGILSLIDDASLRDKLILKGRINRIKYSGETIAGHYHKLYDQAFTDQL